MSYSIGKSKSVAKMNILNKEEVWVDFKNGFVKETRAFLQESFNKQLSLLI
jgi:hypothetical protein